MKNRHKPVQTIRFAAAAVLVTCAALAASTVTPVDPRELLNDERLKELQAGEVVLVEQEYKRDSEATKGQWIALGIIDAPPEAVWEHMADVESHPEFMPRVDRAEVYLEKENRRGVREVVKVLWKEYVYHVLQEYDRGALRMTWTLDKSKENDIKETRGGWTLRPYEDGKTLAAYQLYVDTGRLVPGPLERWLTKKDLPDVVDALRKRAESGGSYKK